MQAPRAAPRQVHCAAAAEGVAPKPMPLRPAARLPTPHTQQPQIVSPLANAATAMSRRSLLSGSVGAAALFAGCACELCGVAPASAAAWGYCTPPHTPHYESQLPGQRIIMQRSSRWTRPRLQSAPITACHQYSELQCVISVHRLQ